MNTSLRHLIRHGAVFGAGAILSRLASIVLLPLYTRHLTPSDYGVIAIVDLTVNLLSIAAGAGLAGAAIREHCADDDPRRQDAVWWTAAVVAVGMSTIVIAPALLGRHAIASAAFGHEMTEGPRYFGLALFTLWISAVLQPFELYFRAVRASLFLTILSFALLLVNVSLNVAMVVGLQMGVTGILFGNLATAGVRLAVVAIAYIRAAGPFAFDVRLVRTYWVFGWPLVVFGLLSACMHEADRYVLRVVLNLREVGLYSIAYQMGQGVNSLVIMPWTTVWSVLVYEIGRESNAPQIYARVFRLFVYGLGLILMGASLFAEFAIGVLAPPEYGAAASIVPVVCLAYLFFSLHDHFKTPALLTGRTTSLIPVVAIAAAANVVLNLALVPRFRAAGAAWASVITFALFSFGGLLQYRRIARYPFPFFSCAAVVGGMCLTVVLHRAFSGAVHDTRLAFIAGMVMWAIWAVALFGGLAVEHLGPYIRLGHLRTRGPGADVAPGEEVVNLSEGAAVRTPAGRNT